MTSVPNHRMTSQECKQYAMQLVGRAWATPYSDVEDRTHLIAEAQVWATLATVPDPPESAASDRFCPHGKFWTDCAECE